MTDGAGEEPTKANVRELRNRDYTPTVLLNDVAAKISEFKGTALFVAIDDEGNPRIWFTTTSHQEIAYLKAAIDRFLSNELFGG